MAQTRTPDKMVIYLRVISVFHHPIPVIPHGVICGPINFFSADKAKLAHGPFHGPNKGFFS